MGRKAGLGSTHPLTVALEDGHLTAQASQVRHKLLHVEQQAGVIWGDRGQRGRGMSGGGDWEGSVVCVLGREDGSQMLLP